MQAFLSSAKIYTVQKSSRHSVLLSLVVTIAAAAVTSNAILGTIDHFPHRPPVLQYPCRFYFRQTTITGLTPFDHVYALFGFFSLPLQLARRN